MASAVLYCQGLATARSTATRIGDHVKFRTERVFLWLQEEQFSTLPPGAELRGTVVEFSDSGQEARVYAVIEVMKKQNVIVAVNDLEPMETGKIEGA